MRALIVGAGIVGAASAYHLARGGVHGAPTVLADSDALATQARGASWLRERPGMDGLGEVQLLPSASAARCRARPQGWPRAGGGTSGAGRRPARPAERRKRAAGYRRAVVPPHDRKGAGPAREDDAGRAAPAASLRARGAGGR